jgi:hypothetical protein
LDNNETPNELKQEALSGNSSTLDLTMEGVTDDDMKIVGNLLRNNKVSG